MSMTQTCLTVTGVATGDIGHGAQPVFRFQSITERELIGETRTVDHDRRCTRGLLISHVEHLIAWPQIFFWSTMTIEAPLHLQRSVLIHQRHAVNRPVASVAADTLVDMNAVVEINVVGQLVHASPLQRFAGSETFPHGLEQSRVGPDLGMAVHAGLRRRNAGKTGILYRSVAVAAINSQASHMMLVAEGSRLRLYNAFIGYVGRALDLGHRPEDERDDEHRSKNRGPRECVRTAMKDLH